MDMQTAWDSQEFRNEVRAHLDAIDRNPGTELAKESRRKLPLVWMPASAPPTGSQPCP